MKLDEAKLKFLHAWGALGSSWGINKTMAQIHALLLISPDPLSTEDVMEQLQISRGNANMNLRALMDWGIVNKDYKTGDRKDYFLADKDVWALAKQVFKERKKREFEPIMKILEEVQNVNASESKEAKEFKKVVKNLKEFSDKSGAVLDKFIRADQNWFFKTLFTMMK